MIAEVIVDIEAHQVNKSYEYLVPSYLEDVLEVGYRVNVPFGYMKRTGFVVKLKETSDYDLSRLKSIIDIIDIIKPLNSEFIELAYYMANEYYSFYSTCLQTMIPSALKIRYNKNIKIIDRNALPKSLLEFIGEKSLIPYNDNVKPFLKEIKKLLNNGSIELENVIYKNAKEKKQKLVYLINEDYTSRGKKTNELISYLKEVNDDIPLTILKNDMGYSDNIIKTLLDRDIIGIKEKEVYRIIDTKVELNFKKVEFTDEQRCVYTNIKSHLGTNAVCLLHGVTGSGKTEIYLELISDVINEGKQAILLVPEISLTPQMVSRFKARFSDKVAIMHSRLSINEKYDEWRKILRGEAKIALGARSAIFAPFTNLGILIIDEEHEDSYRQDKNPRYNTIDIAKVRAKNHNCPLLLGSATPKVCDYYKALEKEYFLYELTNRPNNIPLPKSIVIDLRDELRNGNRSIFSSVLGDKIIERYRNNEQTILFLNRRGFSSFVMCRNCGSVIMCPHCDVSLTYHQNVSHLICHHCGFESPIPTICPKCGSHAIRYVGTGTEKIENDIKRILPEARILRMDKDTTSTKNAYEEYFEKFRKHEADILIGTQMVAKGLDFDDVTLVGVMNADITLKLPYYDSFEKCFDLLLQVSGRSGRKKSNGEVIIQTYDPLNYCIDYAAKSDYKGFYYEEIKRRKIAFNPPFCNIVKILVSGIDKNATLKKTKEIYSYLCRCNKNSIILEPVEDILFILSDKYRYNVNLKLKDSSLNEALKYIIETNQDNKNIFINIIKE